MKNKKITLEKGTEEIEFDSLSEKEKQIYKAGYDLGWDRGHIWLIIPIILLAIINFVK